MGEDEEEDVPRERAGEKGMIWLMVQFSSSLEKQGFESEEAKEDVPLAGWAARMAVWRRARDARMQACRG